MRRFYGFYDNGKYKVGCNGASIWVYDQRDRELARFRDIRYAYSGAFRQGTNIFVAKSTEGWLAWYDLDSLELLCKRKFSTVGASQDDGFAFSPDGLLFYDIERPDVSYDHCLVIYDSESFEPLRTITFDERIIVASFVEFGDSLEDCYLFGFVRETSGIEGVIAKLKNGMLVGDRRLPKEAREIIHWYKDWELSGFTEKDLSWNPIREYPDIVANRCISLRDIYEGDGLGYVLSHCSTSV